MEYRFCDFHFDVEKRNLTRDGQAVAIRPKTAELLTCLLAHRDRRLTKEELLDKVWTDTPVTEAVLFQTMSDLRKILGKRSQPFVDNVSRKGYRWVYDPTHRIEPPPIMEVQPLNEAACDESPPRFARKSKLAAIAILALALIGVLMQWRPASSPEVVMEPRQKEAKRVGLVILSESGLSDKPDATEYEKGLMNIVVTTLNTVPGLRALAFDQAIRLLDPREDAREEDKAAHIQQALGMDYAVLLSLKGTSGSYVLDFEMYRNRTRVGGEIIEHDSIFDCAQWVGDRIARVMKREHEAVPVENLFTGRKAALEFYSLALQAHKLGEHPTARTFLEKAIALDPMFSRARVKLAFVYLDMGLLDEAEELNRTVMEEEQFHKDHGLERACYLNQALLAQRRGNYAEAKRNYQLSAYAAVRSGNALAVAKMEFNVGTACYYMGDLECAGEAYRQSMEIYKREGYQLGLGQSYVNLGNLDLVLENYSAAEINFRNGLEIAEHLGHRWLAASAMSNLGSAVMGLGRFDESEEILKKTLNLAYQLNHDRTITSVLNSLGMLAYEMGDKRASGQWLEQAWEHLGDNGAMAARDQVARNLVELFLEIDEPERAAPYLDFVLENTAEVDPQLLGFQAELAYQQGDPGQASKSLGN